jgi:hypothetical protein
MQLYQEKFNIVYNVLFLIPSIFIISSNLDNNEIYKAQFDTTFCNSILSITVGLYNVDVLVHKMIHQTKLAESINSLIFHSVNTILLHNCLHSTDWFLSLSLFNNVDDHIFSKFELLIYYMQISHYIIELYNIRDQRTKRKDDTEMFIHHIITLTLIIGSFYSNLLRSGLYVMYLHDINDIFLQLSKTLVYLNITEKITDCTFGMFVISWAYTRLYQYGKIVYLMGDNYYNSSFVLNILFYSTCILYMLNLIWFKMILDVLYKKIVDNKKVEDTRE